VLQKPAKLLIVDGDDSMRSSLSRIFSDLGYLVRSGADGSSGLSEIRKEIPDVLLSDLNMVRIPGLEFLIVVRRWLPSIRVIAMARTFPRNLPAHEVAADALVRKSAGPARLIRAVDAMTHPKRSNSRLSIRDSFGFQVLETIPSHPAIQQLRFPASRTMEFPVPQNEQPGETFFVPAVAPAQAASYYELPDLERSRMRSSRQVGYPSL
jgi:CheY-like chemotaxis protein